MKFSLIIATLNRYDELVKLLNSFNNQSYKEFEVIIVDQNDNNRIDNLCNKFKLPIQLHKNKIKGLSINRNFGLRFATGDIIAFPDDDCEYDEDSLEKVKSFFENNPDYNFYTCNTKDKTNESSITHNLSINKIIKPLNAMRTGISFTIFARSSVLKSFQFDEQLGVGAKFGSGEESDLLFYLLKNNNKGRYFSNDYIYHPATSITPDRAFSYGKGFGAVFKKAIFKYNFIILLPIFINYLLKGIIKILFFHTKKINIETFRGRIFGFINYKC